MNRDEACQVLVDLGLELGGELRSSGLNLLWAVRREGVLKSRHLTKGAANRWVEECELPGSWTVTPLTEEHANEELERALEALRVLADTQEGTS
jgi:hypothetical protein